MSQKDFIKNTWDFIVDMVEKEDLLVNQEYLKKNYKKFELILKEIYQSVKDNPIIQNQQKCENTIQRSTSAWSIPGNILGSGKSKNTSSKESIFKPSKADLKVIIGPNGVVLEGILIRKHLMEGDNERAKHRKWAKVWAVIRLHKENGLELLVHKLSNSNAEYIPAEIVGSHIYTEVCVLHTKICEDIHEKSEKELDLVIGEKYNSVDTATSPLRHPVLYSPDQVYKPSHQEPETISLIHSFATVCNYGHGRLYCLSLILANRHVYLLEAPTYAAQIAWLKTINYWAARKSKTPMLGGVGNVDFGWNAIEAEFKSNPSGSKISFAIDMNLAESGSKKLSKWIEPAISPRLISSKDKDSQLQGMKEQLANIKLELEEHELYRLPIEQMWANNPQILQIATSNWKRKNDSLSKECEKYEVYVASLSADVLLEKKIVSSPIKMNESPIKSAKLQ